jgi:hypothetical protein
VDAGFHCDTAAVPGDKIKETDCVIVTGAYNKQGKYSNKSTNQTHQYKGMINHSPISDRGKRFVSSPGQVDHLCDHSVLH